MKLTITIKNFPTEDTARVIERIKTALFRFWRMDYGRNVSDIEFKLEDYNEAQSSSSALFKTS